MGVRGRKEEMEVERELGREGRREGRERGEWQVREIRGNGE